MMLATFVPPGNANTMALLTACGGGGWASGNGPVDAYLTFRDTCRTPVFDMLTIASFPGGQTPQFVWQTGLTHVPNGNVSVATSCSPSMNATWSTKIDATPVQMGGQGIATPVAGNQSVSVNYPPGAGDGAVVNVDVGFFGALSSESRSVVETGAPSAINDDYATQPIPVVSALQQTTNGASWTQTAGNTADVRTLVWRAQLHTGTRVVWTLVEPYDAQALTTFPTMPAGHASEDPTVDVGAQLFGAAVFYVDYDVITGFTLQPPTGSFASHSSSAETFNFQFSF
jgi:hypothetical protein